MARSQEGRQEKVKRKYSFREHAEQAALLKWCEQSVLRLPPLRLLHAIPNGGRRHPAAGARLRAIGLRAGVPDLCLPWPSGRWHGLYIELKSEIGRLSREQKWWLSELNAAGYLAEVCFGWLEAATLIEEYLLAPRALWRKLTAAGKENRHDWSKRD